MLLCVSAERVNNAKAIIKYAPELEHAVKEKKISIRVAANEARSRKNAKKAPPQPTRAEVQAINAAKAANHMPRELTRQEVDPEFIGDMIAFVGEYGHVWMKPSQERSTDRLKDWSHGMRYLAKKLREQKLPTISPHVLSWLRKPRSVDVESLKASLAELELAVATARDLLERAQSSMAESNGQRTNGVVSHGGREVGA